MRKKSQEHSSIDRRLKELEAERARLQNDIRVLSRAVKNPEQRVDWSRLKTASARQAATEEGVAQAPVPTASDEKASAEDSAAPQRDTVMPPPRPDGDLFSWQEHKAAALEQGTEGRRAGGGGASRGAVQGAGDQGPVVSAGRPLAFTPASASRASSSGRP